MPSFKCLVGFHDWSSWREEKDIFGLDLDPLSRKRWPAIFGPASCYQVRTCSRSDCKKKETRIVHTWGDWKYVIVEDSGQNYSHKLRQLRQLLSKRFDESEIRDLCYDLQIEYSDLPGDTKTNKVTELLKRLERYHRLPKFLEIVMPSRTDIPWEEMGLLKLIEPEHFDIEKLSWELDLSETCNQVRECVRCGSKEARKQHAWNSNLEYESSTTCNMVKYCRRCGEKEDIEIQHHWGLWNYESPRSCTVVRMCQRCSAQDKKEEPHPWGEWYYKSPRSCTVVRTCQRCSTQSEGESHSWGEWYYESPRSCTVVRTCQRCSTQEKRGESHSWGEWYYEPSRSCLMRTCSRCGVASIGKKVKPS